MSRRRGTLGGLNIHSTAAGAKPSGSGKELVAGLLLDRKVRNARAAANLVKDLRAPLVPLAVMRREAAESKRLARAVAAGRITLAEAREQLRGCC